MNLSKYPQLKGLVRGGIITEESANYFAEKQDNEAKRDETYQELSHSIISRFQDSLPFFGDLIESKSISSQNIADYIIEFPHRYSAIKLLLNALNEQDLIKRDSD